MSASALRLAKLRRSYFIAWLCCCRRRRRVGALLQPDDADITRLPLLLAGSARTHRRSVVAWLLWAIVWVTSSLVCSRWWWRSTGTAVRGRHRRWDATRACPQPQAPRAPHQTPRTSPAAAFVSHSRYYYVVPTTKLSASLSISRPSALSSVSF